MESLEANTCLFPALTNGDSGKITTASQEIYCKLLPEMNKFCVDNESRMPLFLMTMWSTVLRQYAETNCASVLFGIKIQPDSILDVPGEGEAQCQPRNSIQTCQVSITPETRITDLLGNRENCIQLQDHNREINHNTGILLTGKNKCMNPVALLDEFDNWNKQDTV
jgi:hypothetical protein